MNPTRFTYRVTIRYQSQLQQYEVFDVEALNLREALSEATARFPEGLIETSDLIEVRLANPPE
ncbi:MAG: hypothetical protein PVJ43_05730 [Gemmatimonadales bacterium]|jgi:hypothetical protein